MPRFDSDTKALTERAKLNASRTEHNLEAWIFDQVRPADGMRIADLGCGTGKQLFALAGRLSADTEIVGVDISEQAVAEVNVRASSSHLPGVRALRASLDECPAALPAGHFDLIVSTYAIYYAQDVSALLGRLAGVLNPGGQLFACGPGAGTNREMIALLNGLYQTQEPSVPDIEDFLDTNQIDALGGHYGFASLLRLANTATFSSPAEVLTWWRNHNLYRPALEPAVTRKLEEAFAAGSALRLTKNVLGVHCRV